MSEKEAKLEEIWSNGGLWGLVLVAVGLLAVLTVWINRIPFLSRKCFFASTG